MFLLYDFDMIQIWFVVMVCFWRGFAVVIAGEFSKEGKGR